MIITNKSLKSWILLTTIILPLLVNVAPVRGKVHQLTTTENCGEWTILETVKDNKIKGTIVENKINNECSGSVVLTNGTGILGFGGYSLELVTHSFNAEIMWTQSNESIFLLPSPMRLSLDVTPMNAARDAEVQIIGAITWRSFAIDMGLFVIRTILANYSNSICLINEDDMLLAVLGSYEIFQKTAELALAGDIVGSFKEFSNVIDDYLLLLFNYFESAKFECLVDVIGAILNKPLILLNITKAYLGWVGILFWDYVIDKQEQPEIKIVYTPQEVEFSENYGDIAYVGEGGNIWTINIDGSNNTQVSDEAAQFPKWSPDGNSIYYMRGSTEFDLFAYSFLDQRETPVRLPDGLKISYDYDIAPNGEEFAFLTYPNPLDSDPTDSTLLTIAKINSGEIVKQIFLESWVPVIKYSPTGSQMAVSKCAQCCTMEFYDLNNGQKIQGENIVYGDDIDYFPDDSNVAVEIVTSCGDPLPARCDHPNCDLEDGLYRYTLGTEEYIPILLDDQEFAYKDPAMSGDGNWLAYEAGGSAGNSYVGVVDLENNTNQRIIPGRSPDLNPKFKADSELIETEPSGQLAYLVGNDEDYQIAIYDLDTSDLTTVASGRINSFTWTPDGNSITYSENIAEDEGPLSDKFRITNLNLNQNTSNEVVNPESFYMGGERYYWYDNPRWSANGEALYYGTWDGRVVGNSIFRLNMTTNTIDRIIEPMGSSYFDVSPIDNTIAITHYFNGVEGTELTINDGDGNDIRTIINAREQSYLCCPAFSPDGELIAFSAYKGRFGGNPLSGPAHIWILNTNNFDFTQITKDDTYDDKEPTWSPDGKWIAFSRKPADRSGAADIWITSVEGEELTQITNVQAMAGNLSAREPHWRSVRSILSLPAENTSPTTARLSADEFLQHYYDLINEREYEAAWELLSDNFRNRFNPPSRGGYSGYVSWWDTVERVDVLTIETGSDVGGSVVLNALIRFSYADGRTIQDNHRFTLIQASDSGWLIDNQN